MECLINKGDCPDERYYFLYIATYTVLFEDEVKKSLEGMSDETKV